MPFVEVFTPPGAVSQEQRDQIGRRLVGEVMIAEGAPDNDAARSISWLVWNDADVWSVGGRDVSPDEPARYVVRVTVPQKSLDDDKRNDIVARVTEVLAQADPDPDRLRTTPSVFVLINEILEGNWGSAGRIFTFADIASFIVTGMPDQLDAEGVRETGMGPSAPVREPVSG